MARRGSVRTDEARANEKGFAFSLVESRPGIEIRPLFPTAEDREVVQSCFLPVPERTVRYSNTNLSLKAQ